MRILVIIAIVLLVLWLGVGAFLNLAIGIGEIIVALIPAAIVGWLAGRIVKGGGFGPIGNVLLGMIGGLVGGFIFSILRIGDSNSTLIGTLISGVIGAIIVVFVWGAIRGRGATA